MDRSLPWLLLAIASQLPLSFASCSPGSFPNITLPGADIQAITASEVHNHTFVNPVGTYSFAGNVAANYTKLTFCNVTIAYAHTAHNNDTTHVTRLAAPARPPPGTAASKAPAAAATRRARATSSSARPSATATRPRRRTGGTPRTARSGCRRGGRCAPTTAPSTRSCCSTLRTSPSAT